MKAISNVFSGYAALAQEGQGHVQMIDDTGRLVSHSNIVVQVDSEGAEQAGAKALPGRLLDQML